MEQNKEALKKKTDERLCFALASMGYRKRAGCWAKPFGFALIEVEFKECKVEFHSYTKGLSEVLHWSCKSFDYNNCTSMEEFVQLIAFAEYELQIDKTNDCGERSGETFNFSTPYDFFYIDG